MPEVVLRPAEGEDIAEMLALYAPYVIQTTVSSEYDAPSIEEFTRRWRTYTQKLPWLVCRIDGEVVGYGYAAPHRTRAAYQWSVETSIYVAQEQHRHGIAGAIYAALFELLSTAASLHRMRRRSRPIKPWALSFRAHIRKACINLVSGAMSSGWARACVRMTAHRSRPFRSRRLRTVRW